MEIKIVRQINDNEADVWTFELFDVLKLRLLEYRKTRRKSKRQIVDVFRQAARPIPPPDVIQECKSKVADAILILPR